MSVNLTQILDNPAAYAGLQYIAAMSSTRAAYHQLDWNGKKTEDRAKAYFTCYQIKIDELEQNPFRFRTIRSALDNLFRFANVSYGDITCDKNGVVKIDQADFKSCEGKHLHIAIISAICLIRINYRNSPSGGYLCHQSRPEEISDHDTGKKNGIVKAICANLGIDVSVNDIMNNDGGLEVHYYPKDVVSAQKLKEVIAKLPALPCSEKRAGM